MGWVRGTAPSGVPRPPVASDIASSADLREARGAVALVASGVAVQVVLVGLRSAEATAASIEHEARAQAVRVRFELGPSENLGLVIGPRDA